MSSSLGQDGLIRGAQIVDGTGAPAYRGDIRIAAGRIAEIGVDLQGRGEPE